MAIYGGVIGGALGALAFAKAKKLSFGKLTDMVAPALILGQDTLKPLQMVGIVVAMAGVVMAQYTKGETDNA